MGGYGAVKIALNRPERSMKLWQVYQEYSIM